MQLPESLRGEEEGSSLPEMFLKLLFLSVVLYIGFLFYMQERYLVAATVFAMLFIAAWGLLDSEIF